MALSMAVNWGQVRYQLKYWLHVLNLFFLKLCCFLLDSAIRNVSHDILTQKTWVD